MSRLGLGLAALGGPGYINLGHVADLAGDTDEDEMERNAHAVLDAAYAGGVRYFDAARSYGRAEAFLGSWLRSRGIRRDDATVGSKWGYTYTADWRVDADVHRGQGLSAATLRRQLAESLDVLGDHLRLYQIHSATVESGVLEDDAVRGELNRLRLRWASRSASRSPGPTQAETIERALDVGGFDTVQATWNVLEQAAGPTLARAHAAGLGVIVKEALANGRLTARGDVPRFVETARGLGVEPDALALAGALAQPWADVVLSGAATSEMLASNLAGLELDLDNETRARLDEVREESAAYWRTRAALAWN